MRSARLIAFYLPQFHPIPENDAWWGKGFTEWTNVTKARPLFRGHYQPHLPADLGFYDLRLTDTREAQADLARTYGIDGFCYYHYWFSGKRLLERPFQDVLHSGKPDFPFCLCWANESWTRRWDGHNQKILMEQTYGGEADVREHIKWLLPAFHDPRYIRINGKPLFLIYRAKEIPQVETLIRIWREAARHGGLPDLYLASVDSSWARNWNPMPVGFDAAVEFQPAFTILPGHVLRRPPVQRQWLPFSKRQERHLVVNYDQFVEVMLKRAYPEYKMLRCVTPGFDNSPRRSGLASSIIHESHPKDFGRWLESALRWTRTNLEGEEQIVFVNAWNEWAEGNHLEPDQRLGRAFLEETRRVTKTA